MDGLYFRCLQILNWAGNTLTGIHMSSRQGSYSSAILIFLLPWIQNLQEEAEIHSIFVGCRVESEAVVFWTCYYVTMTLSWQPQAIIQAWGWKGWVVRLKAIDGSDQRLQGEAVLFTAPCWVWKEEEEGQYTAGKSVSRSVMGAGTSSKDRKAHLCLWKIHLAPENKEEMIS